MRKTTPARAALLCVALALLRTAPAAQGGHTLFGDLRVDGGRDDGRRPIVFTVSLHTEDGIVTERQAVSDGGRYRFLNLPNGVYYLVVEAEGVELARIRAEVQSPYKNDFRQDISLTWAPAPGPSAGSVDAASLYKRKPAAQRLFEKADAAAARKSYEEAAALFRRVADSDPADYPAWTELGTMYYAAGKAVEAEDAYARALRERPDFLRAAVNLGRLRIAMKKFGPAVEVLSAAVEKHPASGDANLLLGEAYLQIRKGSKAVPHLEAAARLGRPEAHLRLATLYNAAGLKDRAAAEYEQYLRQKPDAPERTKMEEYIKENRKQ